MAKVINTKNNVKFANESKLAKKEKTAKSANAKQPEKSATRKTAKTEKAKQPEKTKKVPEKSEGKNKIIRPQLDLKGLTIKNDWNRKGKNFSIEGFIPLVTPFLLGKRELKKIGFIGKFSIPEYESAKNNEAIGDFVLLPENKIFSLLVPHVQEKLGDIFGEKITACMSNYYSSMQEKENKKAEKENKKQPEKIVVKKQAPKAEKKTAKKQPEKISVNTTKKAPAKTDKKSAEKSGSKKPIVVSIKAKK